MRIFVIVISIIATIVGAYFLTLYWLLYSIDKYDYNTNASYSEIEQYFMEHKSDFAKLKTMFESDRHPGYIWQDGNNVEEKISSKRIKEYQKLMKNFKLFRIDGDNSYFRIVLISEGLMTSGGRLKGYIYFLEPPKTTYDTLPEGYKSAEPAYKSIGDKWYMFVENTN